MSEEKHEVAIVTTGPDFTIDLVNSGYSRFAGKFGLEKGENSIFGKRFPAIFPEINRQEAESVIHTLLGSDDELWSSSDKISAILDFKTTHGNFYAQVFSLVGETDKEKGFIFLFSPDDVTNQEKHSPEESLTSIMDGMGDAVIIVDENCSITYMNKITRDTLGAPAIGSRFHTAFSGNDNLCPRCNIKVFSEGDITKEVESKNGKHYLATFSPVLERSGRKSVIGVLKDISFRIRMEEELRNLTITDNLTGLFNKRHFMARLEEETVRARRQNRDLSILFADIDGFKKYNDTYGHTEGDVLLSRLGQVFQAALRKNVDSAYRYGGDEFTAILPETSFPEAIQAAERVKEMFNSDSFTPTVNGETVAVKVTISVGVAQYMKDANIESYINRADSAMYSAKRNGGDKVANG